MTTGDPATGPSEARAVPTHWASLLWIALPLFLLGLAAAWLIGGDPMRAFDVGAPPIEKLTFEQRILDETGIRLSIRAGGSEPMSIAQVQVDDAYWSFVQDPPGALGRGSTAWIAIPYPWVLGEAHRVKIVTNTGATFELEIPVAVPTPAANLSQLQRQAVLGGFVGIVPVAIGLAFFPLLRRAGRDAIAFILALTAGLLAFLLVDMLIEAFEVAGEAAPVFQGPVMVVLSALLSFLCLLAVGRRHGAPTGLALAGYIALGIGMHNFGEGLAIGAAFATGAASLGTFLVLGFTLHNITEGLGIAAPLLRLRPKLPTFAWLTVLAGGPAIAGIWVGSLALTPQWAGLALAIGVGAIAQVLVEVGAYVGREQGGLKKAASPANVAGFALGIAVMYATGMLVKI